MQSLEENRNEAHRVVEQVNRAAYAFLMTELELARTFGKVAQITRYPGKQRRNLDFALQACATVVRFRSRLNFTEQQVNELDRQLGEVRDQLETIKVLPGPGETESDI